jgi:hypothetical protein
MLDRAFRAGASGPCGFRRYADFFTSGAKFPGGSPRALATKPLLSVLLEFSNGQTLIH